MKVKNQYFFFKDSALSSIGNIYLFKFLRKTHNICAPLQKWFKSYYAQYIFQLIEGFKIKPVLIIYSKYKKLPDLRIIT